VEIHRPALRRQLAYLAGDRVTSAVYALANHTEHPRSLYVREELIVPALDRWLVRAFSHRAPPHHPELSVFGQSSA
jgi:hypothetical protein